LDSIQTSIFQQLYDDEINFEVSCFWDDGFHVRLGDRMNGYRAEAHVATWQEVEAWLRENAFKESPRPEPAEGRGELVRDLNNEIDVGKPPDDYWP
jgi:hypothetical protein